MGFLRHGRRVELVRGAELARHEFGLYFAAIRFSAGMALLTMVGLSTLLGSWSLTPNERHLLAGRTIAQLSVWLDAPTRPVVMTLNLHGRHVSHRVPAATMLELSRQEWDLVRPKLRQGCLIGVAGAIVVVVLTHWAWRRRGRQVAEDEVLRGARFADVSQVVRALVKSDQASHVRLAGVPLEKGTETLNTMVSGSIGAGKSVAIGEALTCIRQARQKAVIFDSTGEYVERFYREGRDYLLNPFDRRSALWRPTNEIRYPYDFANLAEGFLPVMNQKEPFWELGAQIVLEDVMARLTKHGRVTNRDLVHAINVMTLEEIQQLVASLPAAVYMDPEASRTALGVRMNVVRAARSLRFLEDGPASRHFSIRDWITGPEQDSWLFLSAREDMLNTLRPLITAWMDTALRAVMAMPPDLSRLIWSVLDEVPALDKIPCLKQATTRGRKYGIASILGYQNYAQLLQVHGQNDTQTILSNCQNVLTLRVPDVETAEQIAKNFGTQEVFEKNENLSFGKDASRDGVAIASRRTIRPLVLPSEIQGLPQFHGYLRLAGRGEVMKVAFRYRDYPSIAPAFLEKAVVPYDLDE